MSHFSYQMEHIEKAIKSYLPKREGLAKTVYNAICEAILNGGKRVRPMVMHEVYQLFCPEGHIDEIAPFMAAIEMIHTSSLIHDDLPCMDNDILRRGKPTTWVLYGEDMAVLAGDALIVLASKIIYSVIAKQKEMIKMQRFAKAGEILFQKTGMEGMIGGQVVDIEKTGQPLTYEELDFIYRLKTAALLEASMMIGAVIGGATQEEIAKIEQIARNIGLAFQIQDDILDKTGTEEELGKTIHSDEKNSKTTYVSIWGIEKAKEKTKSLSQEALRLLEEIASVNNKRDITVLQEIILWLTKRKK